MSTTDTPRHAPLADLRARAPRPITPEDEHFHTPATDSPHWTETSWWAFTIPSTGGGGWIYLQTRPHLGLVGVGCWVWDSTSILPWESPYSRQFHHVQLPTAEQADYTHLKLADVGLELECLEPFLRHRIRYSHPGQIELDLEFTAKFEPRPLGVNDQTGHLDQGLWAVGTIDVAGQRLDVDGAAFRDRTWSDRFDNSDDPRKNCYVWGVSSDGSVLHALAIFEREGVNAEHFGGTLHRGAYSSGLSGFRRSCRRRGEDGRPLEIDLVFEDEQGATHTVSGSAESCNAIAAFPGYLSYSSIVRWQWDGTELWGEDHETWPYDALRVVSNGGNGVDRWAQPLQR